MAILNRLKRLKTAVIPLASPRPAIARRLDAASGPKQLKPAAVSVCEFLAKMVEYGGGGELQWKRIRHSYNAMRADHGWPPLSDQVLSQFLLAMQCQRRRRRVPGGGKLTVFRLPVDSDNDLAAPAPANTVISIGITGKKLGPA